MKRRVFTLVLWVAGLGVAHADTVAPGDVVWQDGTIPQSLTGVAGDPAEGAKVLSSKSIGNCIACHEVTALADVPFHGEVGPLLDGAGDRWTEAELRAILVNSKEVFPDSVMPSFYRVDGFIRPGKAYTGKAADDTFGPLLTAQQIEDAVAFLMTLD
ncbi:sulfur oxidation c-type cytochrome SoxX [Maritimibacter fusiformis]|uniref:Sulfur oxidation c-type cytochrome SoxX n=1 Tax=Maritimibacter fusiformis TaxID=2603819 RepID=A0A5D0RKX8_9RHOB|nr:sulfur oxidation c-type cytochrome SoxX [Maritimibacter fusiformis]TYB81435.1 sulfur oxidation c-type cytochrome SoxX [Maritimibacter fusiformis]